MRRNLAIIVCVLLMLMVFSGCDQRVAPSEEWSYELIDGEVTITGYYGTERILSIPDEIEKRPVTRIGAYAFTKYDMTSIELPETLVEISAFSFEDCNCLTEIEIPSKVEVIGEGAFHHCDALERVVLPTGLERIEDGAFNHCGNLKQINLPTELDYLGVGALAYCDALNPVGYRRVSMSYTLEDLETGEIWTMGSEEYSYETGSKNEEMIHAYTHWGWDTHVDTVNRYDEKGRKIYAEKIFSDPDGSNEKSETWWEYDDINEKVTEMRSIDNYPIQTYSISNYNDGVLTSVEYYSNGELEQCDFYIGKWTVEMIISEMYGLKAEVDSDERTEVQCDAFGRYQKEIKSFGEESAPYYVAEYRYDSAGNQIELIEYDYLKNTKSITQFTYEKVK